MLSKRTNFVDQAKWDGTNGHKYSFCTQVTLAERDQSESLQLVLKLNEARSVRVLGIFIENRSDRPRGSLSHIRLIARYVPRITSRCSLKGQSFGSRSEKRDCAYIRRAMPVLYRTHGDP